MTRFTAVDASLVKEVDLGCFKHKVDEGIPLRKAANTLIETLVEKIPDKLDAEDAIRGAINGLNDTTEECIIQCLNILHRLVIWQSISFVS